MPVMVHNNVGMHIGPVRSLAVLRSIVASEQSINLCNVRVKLCCLARGRIRPLLQGTDFELERHQLFGGDMLGGNPTEHHRLAVPLVVHHARDYLCFVWLLGWHRNFLGVDVPSREKTWACLCAVCLAVLLFSGFCCPRRLSALGKFVLLLLVT